MISHARRVFQLAAGAVLLGAASQAHAVVATTTITMDDLPAQAVNGLVHPKGVTFGFTLGGVGSTLARYNTSGPGSQTYVNDPSIEGPTSSSPTSIAALSVLFCAAGVNHQVWRRRKHLRQDARRPGR